MLTMAAYKQVVLIDMGPSECKKYTMLTQHGKSTRHGEEMGKKSSISVFSCKYCVGGLENQHVSSTCVDFWNYDWHTKLCSENLNLSFYKWNPLGIPIIGLPLS